MKKRFAYIVLVVVLGVILYTQQVFCAEKLGYVNLSAIFNAYTKTKEYDKILEAEQKKYEEERQKKAEEIKKLQDKLSLLNEKQRAKKKDEVEEKIKSFQEFDMERRQDLRRERDEKMKEILQDIERAIRQYAEKEGYTLVFNDRVLVYQAKEYDLTDKIIEIVNNNYKRKK
jgi:outer membrane protein